MFDFIPMSSRNLANKFTAKAISGRIEFARYISAPIALRYGTSGPRSFSFSPLGRKRSFSVSSDLTTIGVVNG